MTDKKTKSALPELREYHAPVWGEPVVMEMGYPAAGARSFRHRKRRSQNPSARQRV